MGRKIGNQQRYIRAAEASTEISKDTEDIEDLNTINQLDQLVPAEYLTAAKYHFSQEQMENSPIQTKC